MSIMKQITRTFVSMRNYCHPIIKQNCEGRSALFVHTFLFEFKRLKYNCQ